MKRPTAVRPQATVSFLYLPPTAPLAPAFGAVHVKTVKVARTRFTNPTNLASATLNMAGISEWGGVLEFDATGPGTTFPDCDRFERPGATTGATRAKFDFVGWVAHNGNPTSPSLERQ